MQRINKESCWLIIFSFQVHAEEISGNNGYVELSFCAKKLDDKVRDAVHVSLDMVQLHYWSSDSSDDDDDDDDDHDTAASAGAVPMFIFMQHWISL